MSKHSGRTFKLFDDIDESSSIVCLFPIVVCCVTQHVTRLVSRISAGCHPGQSSLLPLASGSWRPHAETGRSFTLKSTTPVSSNRSDRFARSPVSVTLSFMSVTRKYSLTVSSSSPTAAISAPCTRAARRWSNQAFRT